MAVRPTIFDYVPGIREGGGTVGNITLVASGTLAVANAVDTWVLPACLLPAFPTRGGAITLAAATVSLATTGTGTGGTSVRLVRNGDTVNGVLFSTTIAAGAVTPYVSLDLRSASSQGIPLNVGDNLRLDITAIPGTTASTNLVVHLTYECYAIVA